MKLKLISALVVLSLWFANSRLLAAEAAGAQEELKDLITKVQTKLKEGKKTEADLAGELKSFDELLAKHKGEKTDDVAQILFMKAQLYLQVLDDTGKGIAAIEQLKRDFPALTIVLNGGLDGYDAIERELRHIDGVMLGPQRLCLCLRLPNVVGRLPHVHGDRDNLLVAILLPQHRDTDGGIETTGIDKDDGFH